MDVQEQAIKVSLGVSRITLKAIMQAVRAMLNSQEQIKHGEQSLKRLNLQNKKMDHVDLTGQDIQAFRRELNKYSVDFSVYKEEGTYTVYFKGQDLDRVRQGLENSLKDFAKSTHNKKPVKEVMDDAVNRAATREAERKGKEQEHNTEKGAER
jgi:hypothetical protein